MPTRPTPARADRAQRSDYADSIPFVGEGFTRGFLAIDGFLHDHSQLRIADLLSAADIDLPVVDRLVVDRPVVGSAPIASATVTVVAAAQAPVIGVLSEATTPDRVLGIDVQALQTDLGLPAPAADAEPASALRDEAARTADAIVTVQTVANEPPTSADVRPTLQGGPLTVHFDPVLALAIENAGAAARPVSDIAAAIPVQPAGPINALQWAPVLEAYSGGASAHVPMFDIDGNSDSAPAVFDLPILPPITPPNGDGLGG